MREPSPAADSASRRTPALLALGVALLAALVYANALRNGFALDDEYIVANNPLVRGDGPLRDLLLGPYWPQSGELYRPVTLLSLALDWAVSGGSAAWMHGVNVLLHAAATALVALLVWRLGGGRVAAAAAGAVFAVHPVHVEAVSNVVGRAEMLATIPVLLACHLYLTDRIGRWGRYALIALLYLVALGSKEIAVALPALLLAVDAVRSRAERTTAWRLLARNLPLLAALVATLAGYLVLRRLALGATVGTDPAPYLRGLSAPDRVATAMRLWPEYLRLLLWPADLSAEWGPDAITTVTWASPLAWLGVAICVALAVIACLSWRRSRWVFAAILWFVACILPVSHILFPVGVMVAERTLYLPSASLAFLLPALVAALARERMAVRRAAAGALAALLVLGALRTWRRTPSWASSNAVFDVMVDEHPELWWVEWKAGRLLAQAGRYDEALVWYRRAMPKVNYNHYTMAMDYSSLLLALGRGDEAEPVLTHAVRTFPNSVPAFLYLASLRIEHGRYREAVELARRGAAVPHYGPMSMVEAGHRLALGYDGLGQIDSALVYRRMTLADPAGRPHSNMWYHYARLLAESGDARGAAAALDSARARAAPAVRPLMRLDPLPPIASARLTGWGRVEAPGAAAAEASPRAPAGPP